MAYGSFKQFWGITGRIDSPTVEKVIGQEDRSVFIFVTTCHSPGVRPPDNFPIRFLVSKVQKSIILVRGTTSTEGPERMLNQISIALACVGAATICYVVGKTMSRRIRDGNTTRAQKLFSQRREWLEADFVTQAQRSGRPRGLQWANCDFENDVAYARDRTNGQLRALVGVTISFEAIPGGGMEDVEAVGNLRCATAVFRFYRNRWETEGRAIFNLRPNEAILHFKHELEAV